MNGTMASGKELVKTLVEAKLDPKTGKFQEIYS